MAYASEQQFENYVRSLIDKHITSKDKNVYTLKNKKAVDILVVNDGQQPSISFVEIKYHKKTHGRLGFGSKNGYGIQPEILLRRPSYFETNLRWVISSEGTDRIFVLDNAQLLRYVGGGSVGSKFNNIQAKLFKVQRGLTEAEFIQYLESWLLPKNIDKKGRQNKSKRAGT